MTGAAATPTFINPENKETRFAGDAMTEQEDGTREEGPLGEGAFDCTGFDCNEMDGSGFDGVESDEDALGENRSNFSVSGEGE